jgi:hypothetical protein
MDRNVAHYNVRIRLVGLRMAIPPGWNATQALASYPLRAWCGEVWRGHDRDYQGDDAGGSLLFSGRYNRGIDTTPVDECWQALYTSVDRSICYAERLRHTEFDQPRLAAAKWARTVFSRLEIDPHAVLTFMDPGPAGLTIDDLCQDTGDPKADYWAPQEIAAEAIRLGAEALLVPSATRLDDQVPNVLIFTTKLRPGSHVVVAERVEPNHLGHGVQTRLLGPNP